MKASRSPLALIVTVVLHLLLAALMLNTVRQSRRSAEVTPVTVQLLKTVAPTPPKPVRQPPRPMLPARAPAPARLREPTPVARPLRATAAVVIPAQSAPSAVSETAPTTPTLPPALAPASAPTSAPTPVPAPAPPPVKTAVSLSASYAASNRKPDYPAMSRRHDEQGTVLLRVFVNADGTAGTVQIKTSSGFPLLDQAAREAVQSWHFQPATLDGKPIAEWYQIPIPFTLKNE